MNLGFFVVIFNAPSSLYTTIDFGIEQDRRDVSQVKVYKRSSFSNNKRREYQHESENGRHNRQQHTDDSKRKENM